MFRRRREPDDDPEVAEDYLDEVDGEGVEGDVDETDEDEPVRTAGPWDVHDAPTDDTPRLDLGALLVPVPEGLEVRVEVEDDVAVAATFVDGDSLLQIHVFAAPKSAGIWAEVRDEIAESLRDTPGSAEVADGPFGGELRARVPEENGTVPARFIGVDGPRWFLRGLVTGPAATDPGRSRRLEEAFRSVIVVRGVEAFAPRDLLPLRLPREAAEAVAASQAEQENPLSMPERGPEITETR